MKRILCILTLALPLLVAAQAPADTANTVEVGVPGGDLDRGDTVPAGLERMEDFAGPKLKDRKLLFDCLVYPAEAKKDKISGRVVVRVLLNEAGKPIDHQIAKSPHKALSEEVARCVYHLEYHPAMYKGKPIKYWVVMPVDFRL